MFKLMFQLKHASSTTMKPAYFCTTQQLWTQTKTKDLMDRRLVRAACINIAWPMKLNNEKVYDGAKL